MKGTIIKNRRYSYIGPLPGEEEAIRILEQRGMIPESPPLYGFLPITPGKSDIEKTPELDLYSRSGDIAYLAFAGGSMRAGRLDDPVPDPRSRSQLLSHLALHEDPALAKILNEVPEKERFRELVKLYNSNPQKYGGAEGPDLRRLMIRMQFVRDWEQYLKILSGRDGALGKAERRAMFEEMRKETDRKYLGSNPSLCKKVQEQINKAETETEKFLSKEGAGNLIVLMKQEWSDILDRLQIKDRAVRKAFYEAAINATKKAKWTTDRRKESILDRDGIKKFFRDINRNAPDEAKRSNMLAEKKLNDVLDKYKEEKDCKGGGFSDKTYAVVCSNVVIDRAANMFSIGITISDGDNVEYIHSNVSSEYGAEIKCAEMNMNGELIGYVENEADLDYMQDKKEDKEEITERETEYEEIREDGQEEGSYSQDEGFFDK